MQNPTLRLILTPIAAAVSAALTGWLAKHFPGVNLPAKDLTPLMVVGALAGAGAAVHWLQSQPKVVQLEDEAKAELAKIRLAVEADSAATASLADLRTDLKAHADRIIQSVGNAVHAPASIVTLLQSVVEAVESQNAPKAEEPKPAEEPAPDLAQPAPVEALPAAPIGEQPGVPA